MHFLYVFHHFTYLLVKFQVYFLCFFSICMIVAALCCCPGSFLVHLSFRYILPSCLVVFSPFVVLSHCDSLHVSHLCSVLAPPPSCVTPMCIYLLPPRVFKCVCSPFSFLRDHCIPVVPSFLLILVI